MNPTTNEAIESTEQRDAMNAKFIGETIARFRGNREAAIRFLAHAVQVGRRAMRAEFDRLVPVSG